MVLLQTVLDCVSTMQKFQILLMYMELLQTLLDCISIMQSFKSYFNINCFTIWFESLPWVAWLACA